jgi:uncharacterized membrane protein
MTATPARSETTIALPRPARGDDTADIVPFPGRAEPPRPSIGRILGLDLARALAVFGMYYSHVGPYGGSDNAFLAFLADIPHGRSSALFATLAGLSLVLLSGGRTVPTGRDGRQRAVTIVIRAIVLLAIGTALTASGTGIVVILAFYGVYFLLALPFRRLRARTLAIMAAGVAVLGPIANHLLTFTGDWMWTVGDYDPIAKLGGDGVMSILFNGTYPAVTWMAYIFAGMALGKLALGEKATQVRLAIAGPVLALLGYGGSWLLLKLPVFANLMSDDFLDIDDEKWKALDKLWETDPEKAEAKFDALFPDDFGDKGDFSMWSPESLSGLLTASPHSNTTFETVGNIGVAITVIVAAVALLSRSRLAAKLLTPFTAVGAMSLTVYVGHVFAFDWLSDREGTALMGTGGMTLWFIGVATAFAFLWSRFFKRGPLEYGMTLLTKPAKLVK